MTLPLSSIRACALVAMSALIACANDDPTPLQGPGHTGDTAGPPLGGPAGSPPGTPAPTGSGGAGNPGGEPGGPPSPVVTDGGAGGIPKLNVDLKQTSVSGISSGGYMAVQFHVAHSSIMRGAAVFAGGPFYCAQGQIANAYMHCMYPQSAPDVSPFVQTTRDWAAKGLIDDPGHLQGQKVLLFGGANDDMVYPPVMDALKSYYATFVGESSITYESRHPNTAHTMPTTNFGTQCNVSMQPWLGICQYDGAGEALKQIYGALNPPASAPQGSFVTIQQGAFLQNPAAHSVADTGYLYVPPSCARGETCRVHVVFHGCKQNATGAVGDAFYKHAGYNEWADTNHLLVLYPQTIAVTANPNACWDWWGYDSADYANQKGPQMGMVRAMLDQLAAGKAP